MVDVVSGRDRGVNETQARILRLLVTSEVPRSGEAMSGELGITRAAIAKAIDGLRALGYIVESTPRVGHRLVARPDRLLPFEVTDGLRTHRLGHAVHHLERTASTQDVARELIRDGAADGTLVVAEEQSEARGRLSRSYVSPPGGIWCTLILHGPLNPAVASYVSLAAGLAAARAIDEVSGLQTTLKWPNDVLIGERKVTGILTEAMSEEQAIHYVLLGTGINANMSTSALPPAVRATATSLSADARRPVDRRRLLQRYLEAFEPLWDRLLAGDGSPVIAGWRAHRNILGRRVRADRWGAPIEGVATGLDDDGALLVTPDDGEAVRITVGDVQALPDLIDTAEGARHA